MNLAKIRQKVQNREAREQAVEAERVSLDAPQSEAPSAAAAPSPDAADDRPSVADTAGAVIPESRQNPLPRRARHIDPLDIILAGRAAAGCDDDLPLASEGQVVAEVSEYEEILCFRISNEIYGINIMELKEIIKPRETTEVPRAPVFIMGVISLRGVIIPVFNMRERLGLPQGERNGRERIVIAKRNEGFTGLLVDEVIQVVRIGKEEREPAPAVLEGIDRDFVCGIGRTGTMMIILLNVASITDINLC
ncbi:chemotaxis protein CheW [Oryzomonas japonica]|uniref:Chemotaxis protein CheW n=1 Tax=Oryzomonas japonica TaxID=2603858 RepID=A0A7J4ZTY0_9BACT|nr:chemotaxis protein CheW [Oryzomonas japonica]KAB0666882.1 chemotaxis protein CheW [Oryzomonas japonica]